MIELPEAHVLAKQSNEIPKGKKEKIVVPFGNCNNYAYSSVI
jgi:hypothetical protein